MRKKEKEKEGRKKRKKERNKKTNIIYNVEFVYSRLCLFSHFYHHDCGDGYTKYIL